jgi:hypothetical protein
MVSKQTNKGGQMSHGETMEKLGRIIALQEVMIHMQDEVNKLNKQLQEAERGSSETSINRG